MFKEFLRNILIVINIAPAIKILVEDDIMKFLLQMWIFNSEKKG